MKKILAIILISLMLLASCADPGSGGSTGNGNIIDSTTAPETTADETTTLNQADLLKVNVVLNKADFYIFTTDIPSPSEMPELYPWPENLLDYTFKLSNISVNANSYSDDGLSFEFPLTEYKEKKLADGTMSSSKADCSKAGIIDSKEKLSAIIEKGIGKNYADLYADDFFEKNIILYISRYVGGSVFYEFEYGFDLETKLLAIHFTQPLADMCMHSEMLHTYDYFITIPKEAITVDGKMIPYNELSFRLTGYIEN